MQQTDNTHIMKTTINTNQTQIVENQHNLGEKKQQLTHITNKQ